MPLLFDKILSQLAYPLGASLLLMLLAMLLLVLQRRGWALLMLSCSVLWLWGWSTPMGARLVTQSLEDAFPPRAMDELPLAEVIVVLGGGLRPSAGIRITPDLDHAADRIWHAARLYDAGLAPRVLVSGGNVWPGARESEAAATRTLLRDLGVPDAAIVLEERSRNTHQNAVETATLLRQLMAEPGVETSTDTSTGAGTGTAIDPGDDAVTNVVRESGGPDPAALPSVLLVTSASHMRRSVAVFRAAGFDATPAATDHDSGVPPPLALDLLPDASALARSTAALKEYLGLWVYRLRGWA